MGRNGEKNAIKAKLPRKKRLQAERPLQPTQLSRQQIEIAAAKGLVHRWFYQEAEQEKQSQIPKVTPKNKVLESLLSRLRNGQPDPQKYIRRLEKMQVEHTTMPKIEKPEELCCPVCIDLMVQPYVLSCGHCFCRKCLDTTFDYKVECPMCRQSLQGSEPMPCLALKELVDRHIAKLKDHSIRVTFEERVRDAQNYAKERELTEAEIGEKVDIRDQKYNWYAGVVTNIFEIKGKAHLIVKYRDWSKNYQELIPMSDERVAPHRTHTKPGSSTNPIFLTTNQSNLGFRFSGPDLYLFRLTAQNDPNSQTIPISNHQESNGPELLGSASVDSSELMPDGESNQ